MPWRLRVQPLTDKREKGVLRLRFHEEDYKLAADMVRAWIDRFRREVEKSKSRGGEINEPWLVAPVTWLAEKRTLGQNGLLRALERILAAEVHDSDKLADLVHEDLLDLYAPEMTDDQGEVVLKKNGTAMHKRSSACTIGEMSRIIEGAFIELNLQGVGLDRAQQIANYWKEFRTWRKHRHALDASYANLEEYRSRQPFCERCIFNQGEHLAHIWPRALKGPDEAWNVLHLCQECHVMAPESQHEAGWLVFCRSAPHLLGKVNDARAAGQLAEIKLEAA